MPPTGPLLTTDPRNATPAASDNLMAQGVYRGAMHEAREALGEPHSVRAGRFI